MINSTTHPTATPCAILERARVRDAAVIRSVLVAIGMSALTSDLGAQTERRTLEGNSVSVYNLAGRVRVEQGSGSDVVVEVTRGGRDGSRLRLTTSEVRGRNTLSVVYPDDDIVYNGSRGDSRRRWGQSRTELRVNDDGTWGGEGRWNGGRRVRIATNGSGLEAWADLRILVPSGRKLDVNVGVGELEVSRVSADLSLDVAAAHVTVTGTRGRLSIDAGSGGIEVRDVETDDLTIDTGSGGVTFSNVTGRNCRIDTGSGGITGDRMNCDLVNIDAGSGGIQIDDVRAPSANIETGSGGVRLGLRTAPRDLRVESGSGGVTVSMPEGAGADVDIQTGSGRIQTDFPLAASRVERNHVRGRIGNGSGRIVIESGSGSVNLRRTS